MGTQMDSIDVKIPVNEPETEDSLKETLLEKTSNAGEIVPTISVVANRKLSEKNENAFLRAIGSIQTLKSLSPKRIEARTVLWYLVFCGFAVNYMIRLTASIAITEMIAQKPASFKKAHVSECLRNDLITNQTSSTIVDMLIMANQSLDNSSNAIPKYIANIERFSIEKAVLRFLQIEHDANGFHWNEKEQGRLLGSFYWIHGVLQIPGGLLGRRYGTKLIFGLANFSGAILGFLMPIAAYVDVNYIIILRMLQGLVTGLSWPAMHSMTAQWVPPNERSKFVTAYLGSSVGTALFYPIFGFVLSYLSWEWVFHLSAILGTIWYVAWLYFVYDTPAKHPRIDMQERVYIEESLGDTCKRNKTDKTPWMAIVTSRPIWIMVIAQWGGIWGLFTILTQAPTYFKLIHGWGIQMTGLLAGVPHLFRMVFAYCFSTFADWLLKTDRITRSNLRKLAGSFCCIINGIFVVGLAFSGCNATMAIIFVILATGCHGTVSTGPLANVLDISPNYSGLILGIMNTITTCPGFISPWLVGIVGNQTVEQWQITFLIGAAMLIVCGIVYVLYADANLQIWNDPNYKKKMHAEKDIENIDIKKTDKENHIIM